MASLKNMIVLVTFLELEWSFYLTGPNPGDYKTIVLKDIEYFQNSSGVTKYWDAGIRDGEIQSEEICRL